MGNLGNSVKNERYMGTLLILRSLGESVNIGRLREICKESKTSQVCEE